MLAIFCVYDAEHRGQRRAFARAGVARDKDQSPGQIGKVFNDWGQVQVVDIRNLIRNQTKSDSDCSSLVVSVDTESMAVIESCREVGVAERFEFFEAVRAEHAEDHFLGVFVADDGEIHINKVGVFTQNRRQARR